LCRHMPISGLGAGVFKAAALVGATVAVTSADESQRVELRPRRELPGKARGEAIVSRSPIGFYGGINPKTGIVIEKGHELEGKSVRGKILVFP
jgi:hypothetical protein